jgi:hypothetical protein
MFSFIKGFLSFILIIFIVGPILSTSYYYSIKSDSVSTSLQSYGFIIAIGIGLIDSALYGIGLYLSIQTVNELDDQRISVDRKLVNYPKDFRSIISHEKQLLQPISETIELLIRTQADLHTLIKDLVKNTTTDDVLMQNNANKLTTLEFIQKDGLMTIKKNINETLQLLKLNSLISKTNKKSIYAYLNHSTPSNSYIFNRVHLYIFTCSFLLYIHQLALWFFQYLYTKNPKKYLSYPFILSVIILSQSLGLIYFLQITSIFHFLSPLYIYTCLFFIRSLISIYHHTYSAY